MDAQLNNNENIYFGFEHAHTRFVLILNPYRILHWAFWTSEIQILYRNVYDWIDCSGYEVVGWTEEREGERTLL